MHTLHHGDCLDVLRTLPPCSVDAVVTDPPAGIAFMGKAWDGDRGGRDQWVAWLAERLAECLRVLKPGGHAVVWALPRTSGWTHRALEDAGFEVRDCITHLFGSGFPKSLDVGKAIDKAAGAEREVVGRGPHDAKRTVALGRGSTICREGGDALVGQVLTAPATPEAQQWDGWGTALKPAAEFWYLARKPLTGTVAGNVTAYGTGALNIDGCRVPGEWTTWRRKDGSIAEGLGASSPMPMDRDRDEGRKRPASQEHAAGRWPANVALTHNADCDGECSPGCAVAELDKQSGTLSRASTYVRSSATVLRPGAVYTSRSEGETVTAYGDSGGASRFFPTFRYQAPNIATTRVQPDGAPPPLVGLPSSAGCPPGSTDDTYPDHGSSLPLHSQNNNPWSHGTARHIEPTFKYQAKPSTREKGTGLDDRNPHPTVKPVELMRWLVRLVTPPGGTVLDCFAGSGSTLVAATLEGFDSIGVEAEAEYLPVIEGRVGWAERQAVQDALPGF